MTLQIDKAKAMQLYQNGNKEVRQALADLLGDQLVGNYIPEDIMMKFEVACTLQGIEPSQVLHHNTDGLNEEQQVANAYTMLRILTKARQGLWKPDWNNSSQWKYYPWFYYKAGVGFVVYDAYCGNSNSYAVVASRLCFPSHEMAIEFGREFIELYKIILSN